MDKITNFESFFSEIDIILRQLSDLKLPIDLKDLVVRCKSNVQKLIDSEVVDEPEISSLLQISLLEGISSDFVKLINFLSKAGNVNLVKRLEKCVRFIMHTLGDLHYSGENTDNSKTQIAENIKILQSEIVDLQKKQSLFSEHRSASKEFFKRIEHSENHIAKIKANAEEKINAITSNLDFNAKKIAETVGRLSTDAVSGRFSIRAEEESKSANLMQYFAITLMLFAVIIVLLSTFQVIDYFGWQDVIIRSLATITLFITAGYLASESNKHRALQHKYERIHLDLSAIDPFIASFDDETQKNLKTEVAKRVFVTSHEGSRKDNSCEELNSEHVVALMGEFLKVIKAISEKK